MIPYLAFLICAFSVTLISPVNTIKCHSCETYSITDISGYRFNDTCSNRNSWGVEECDDVFCYKSISTYKRGGKQNLQLVITSLRFEFSLVQFFQTFLETPLGQDVLERPIVKIYELKSMEQLLMTLVINVQETFAIQRH